MVVYPFFKTNYSSGRGIITLEEPSKCTEGGPDSAIKMAIDNLFNYLIIVDDRISGFIKAYNKCREHNLKFIFGLRLSVVSSYEEKKDYPTEHKVVIFIKNSQGYKDLIKIWNKASSNKPEKFYISNRDLLEFWTPNLDLVIPFYDSFIYNNLFHFSSCSPEFGEIPFKCEVQDNKIYFDPYLREKVKELSGNNIIYSKSIYYNKREDFDAYLTYRCINARTTFDKPNLDHMASREFSMQSYLELDDRFKQFTLR